MLVAFWDFQGIILKKRVTEGKTVNLAFYVNVLEELREEIKLEIRGKLSKGLLLLHDNARPHTSAQTMESLRGLNMEILPDPPYSPDLAPSDYYLFGSMKKFSRDTDFLPFNEGVLQFSSGRKVPPKLGS